MSKPLNEMTLEELWRLFPIKLDHHSDLWNYSYIKERDNLNKLLLPINERIEINHIGSTSIKDIMAKSIVDIIIEIPKHISMYVIKECLKSNGYTCMSENEARISFNKGYTENGFADEVFHIHLRYFGDNDELYFRDYLNENPAIARQYEELKISLWKKYEYNRDAYTDAKTSFVTKYTEIAKKKYHDKYNK